ncbi:unnamed protein product [Owenia fusiformis]|uniref:Uncharacterized protein n=1 Tax=Owenia fusiformis TaxID=6347 RepID=A0A8J1XMP0_OWEFU|nr:unnamed protein product [Owenia fusiformis]
MDDLTSLTGPGPGSTCSSSAASTPTHSSIPASDTLSTISDTSSQVTSISEISVEALPEVTETKLPWGATREKIDFPASVAIDGYAKPGEFVLRTLFAEFTVLAEKKLEQIMAEPLERPLSKSLQREVDPQFDQLLTSLSCVAEHCLPSLLRTLFAWYELQTPSEASSPQKKSKNKVEKDYLQERRDLGIDFMLCLVLIEVLKQLPYHPGHEDLSNRITVMAFKHFKYKEGSQNGPSAVNINIIADLYAEVIGVLAQSRFHVVRKRFLTEIKELRYRDQTPYTTHSIISLLMGMKFFRVKMHPIESFEACVQFLQECATYFLEVKDKDIKHALAGLFVEILLPVAAVVKMEVNVPVLKNFVDMLYPTTIDMATRRKHCLALYPMVTCLLCVSQKTFFLNNWPYFLTMCLSQLRNKDTKMSRVALESLYRLLWVYMIRIKCESNSATQSRLQSIVNSLFPKGSKVIMPRDMPLNIFVKIIQFIAQERLDFAMREIVFDLLCVGRQIRANLTPERMSVGLRSFLVVADSLQQKDGEPPMPQSIGSLPSGSTVRVKKVFLSKILTSQAAKEIGIAPYLPHVRKAFDSILRALDLQVGRPMLVNKTENMNKEPDELITGERKPKTDLFRTCVAAIPRVIPDGMSRLELVDLLSRLTLHMDEELKGLALQALQNLVVDFSDWRDDVIHGFIQFIMKEIGDTMPQLLDNSLKILLQFLQQWKTSAINTSDKDQHGDVQELSAHRLPFDKSTHANVLNEVEGFALVMLCNCRPLTRKLAVLLMKEVRNLFNVIGVSKVDDPLVIDVLDRACPSILEGIQDKLPAHEKSSLMTSLTHIDLSWLADRTTSFWVSGYHDNQENSHGGIHIRSVGSFDPWIECLSGFLSMDHALGHCHTAVSNAWACVYPRLTELFAYVDPNNATSETRASFLRSGSKKITSERDQYINLWHNYVVFACCIAPSSVNFSTRSSSPELLSSSPESSSSERSEVKTPNPPVSFNASNLFKQITQHIRCETTDMRDSVVDALSRINPESFRDLVDELIQYIKEAIDKKQENMRRRRRRDVLRVQLARIFHGIAARGSFAHRNAGVINPETFKLTSTFVDYIQGATSFLENEGERDLPILQEIRLHFSAFIRNLIRNTPVENRGKLLSRDLRYSLFYLFGSWSGQYTVSNTFGSLNRRNEKEESCTELELSALQAMSAVLCCGPTFDPTGLSEDGYCYNWLDTLLSTQDSKICNLAVETLTLLLDYNPNEQCLLDWVIDCCYTGSSSVADGCFNALATVFNNREYPCDHVAMLNVTLLNCGCARTSIHKTAVELLQLLDKRFFLDELVIVDSSQGPDVKPDDKRQCKMALCASYSHTQLYLSEQLSRLHPELTVPIWSEISLRFQTARPAIRSIMLHYLLPWLHNMELVDPNLPGNPLSNFLSKMADAQHDYLKPPLKGEGWGSTQATEMVLNNLFYMTTKFGDDHNKELSVIWSALVDCWSNNLKIIVRYLIIVAGMAPTELLPYAKRVIVYLANSKPDKLIDDIMNELQTVESLTYNVERTQTPPFYRLTTIKKAMTSPEVQKRNGHPCNEEVLEKGVLHTKRHSTDEKEDTSRTNSAASLRSLCSTTSTSSAKNDVTTKIHDITPEDDIIPMTIVNVTSRPGIERLRSESPVPYPLPMPAYGGYFAPLSEFLPDKMEPNQGFNRCNLAVMLLTDLVVDGLDVDWTAHLPLMLHVIFLGMDNPKSLVHEHCKTLLLNLLLVLARHGDDQIELTKVLLSNRNINNECSLTCPTDYVKEFTFIESPEKKTESQLQAGPVGQSTFSVNSALTITPENGIELVNVDRLHNTEEVCKALIEFLSSRKNRPLWNYEDITSKMLTIKSADQLEHFIGYVLNIFKESQPMAHLEQRWTQIALQLALACSSRHYAGRSFQVFRALRVPITSRMLSDILSRLVETVSEPGEDMQGYVTEIMLTLESAVDVLDLGFRPMDFMKELFMSTPNLTKEPRSEMKKSATVVLRTSPPHHMRSTSYNFSGVINRKSDVPGAEGKGDARLGDARQRTSLELDTRKQYTNLSRSRSAQSLKNLTDPGAQDDKLTILSQMFWVAVSLLESDYEYEFVLAIRLLEKIIRNIQLDRPDCREKLDKILQQINWPNFPGVQALLLKGCTSSVTSEPTWNILSQLTLAINAPVVDPTQALGFPMNVIALLPLMVEHYEDPPTSCREAADRISQICIEQSKKLDNLATVMTLYSRGTFGKDSFQWTKCVVKYLHDVYATLSVNFISLLVEVLEKGPTCTQPAVLQILHCLVHYVDLQVTSSVTVNNDLLRVVAKYVEGPHYKEALKILKLVVARSSSLTAPPPSTRAASISMNDLSSLSSHTSFAEAEISIKKELPGRTLDFSYDLSQTQVIGRKYSPTIESNLTSNKEELESRESGVEAANSDGSSGSHYGVQDAVVGGWKKPHYGQGRTRDRLVNLLTCYGQRVGLPKSPSVIFSQSSDTIERQPSMSASSEEASLVEGIPGDMKLEDSNSSEQQFRLFKEFDFLDIELEEGEGENAAAWGLKRQSLTSLDSEESQMRQSQSLNTLVKEESSDDEVRSMSPVDELVLTQDLSSSGSILMQTSLSLDRRRRHSSPMTGSSHSVQSLGSEAEFTDLSPSNASPSYSNMATAFLNLQSEDIEDQWRDHVANIMRDSNGIYAENTFSLFTKLFKDTKRKLGTLTKEACYFLSKTKALGTITRQLLDMLELLVTQAECPFVYADTEALTSCQILRDHKFAVLEINESYDTYLMRKDQAMDCLENIKSSVKSQSLGQNVSNFCGEEQKIEQCRCLYKLQFQLLLLFESFAKLVKLLEVTAKPDQITDLSSDVTMLSLELQRHLSESDGEASPVMVDISALSKKEAELQVFEYIENRQLGKVIQIVHTLRSMWPSDIFGRTSEDDTEALLTIYCKHMAERKPGIVAITRPELSLTDIISRLMEVNVQISSSIRTLDESAKIDREVIMKLPESSVL